MNVVSSWPIMASLQTLLLTWQKSYMMEMPLLLAMWLHGRELAIWLPLLEQSWLMHTGGGIGQLQHSPRYTSLEVILLCSAMLHSVLLLIKEGKWMAYAGRNCLLDSMWFLLIQHSLLPNDISLWRISVKLKIFSISTALNPHTKRKKF